MDGETTQGDLRGQWGKILAPVVFIILWWIPIPGLSESAHRLLAIEGLVITLWITEAIPLAITALLGPSLCVVFGIDSVKNAFKGFSDPIIFLFIGSFLLAEAVLRHGLNRRIAQKMLSFAGSSATPTRLMVIYAAVTGGISMWISNTATTAMMLPIGISILVEMARHQSGKLGRPVEYRTLPFSTGLMLMTSFAASIGGIGTPVGTPPNLIGMGIIEEHLKIHISFFSWMVFGIPLMITTLVLLVIYFHFAFPAREKLTIPISEEHPAPLLRSEKNILFAFGITLILWITPGMISLAKGSSDPLSQWLTSHIPESVASLTGAVILFLLPEKKGRPTATLTWEDATRIDWGTILLFGGGLSLGEMMSSTGLASWMGESMASTLQIKSLVTLTFFSAVIAIIVSEMTSNAASAAMMVPVTIALGHAAGVDPLPPALAACLGASFGFMMPISTAPNALVYGTGCVPLVKMIRYGIILDILGAILVTLTALLASSVVR